MQVGSTELFTLAAKPSPNVLTMPYIEMQRVVFWWLSDPDTCLSSL